MWHLQADIPLLSALDQADAPMSSHVPPSGAQGEVSLGVGVPTGGFGAEHQLFVTGGHSHILPPT